MDKPKLNYGKTFLIGFGFFGISVMWTLYNTYVPIFLQAGNRTSKLLEKSVLASNRHYRLHYDAR